jgi:hypothetical protein
MGKVWITKYALTKGIYEAEVEDFDDIDFHSVLILKGGHYYGRIYSPHWHKTKESAIAQAEKMRTSVLNRWKSRLQSWKR